MWVDLVRHHHRSDTPADPVPSPLLERKEEEVCAQSTMPGAVVSIAALSQRNNRLLDLVVPL